VGASLEGGVVPTFYVDASVPIHVAQALQLVRTDIMYPGAVGCPVVTANVPDAEWLATAGENDWVVIMKDRKIRTRPWERQALSEAGVRAFCMTAAGNYSKWRTLQLLVERWDAIERTADAVDGPYICSVTQSGVRFLAA
jgi:hypothetical protein